MTADPISDITNDFSSPKLGTQKSGKRMDRLVSSGGGSVGRPITSDARCPRFEILSTTMNILVANSI